MEKRRGRERVVGKTRVTAAAVAIAGRAPAAPPVSPPAATGETEDRGEWLGFPVRIARGLFCSGDRPGGPSDLHRTGDSERRGAQQALSRLGLGLQSEWQLESAAQVATQRAGRLWAASLRQKKCFFFSVSFYITVFNCFCSDFEQISNSFLYSNYSNERLFREFKSDRNFSVKYNVNEFLIHLFRCK
jgi:hypothetical protein